MNPKASPLEFPLTIDVARSRVTHMTVWVVTRFQAEPCLVICAHFGVFKLILFVHKSCF